MIRKLTWNEVPTTKIEYAYYLPSRKSEEKLYALPIKLEGVELKRVLSKCDRQKTYFNRSKPGERLIVLTRNRRDHATLCSGESEERKKIRHDCFDCSARL